MTQARSVVLLAASFLALSATGAANVLPTTSRHAVAQRQGGWMARDADARHPWLYVAGYNNSAVFIYDLAKIGTPQIGEITQGVDGPAGITLDSYGALYVVDQNANSVTIYPAGSTTPTLTLSQGLDFPNSAAIDANGRVYVSSRSSTPASIVVYPPGSSTPLSTITSPLIQDPLQEVFDSVGNLYFTDYSTGVNEIPAGTQQPQSLGLQGAPSPAGIALDPTDRNLFVQNYAPNAYKTLVYAPGSVYPTRTIKNGLAANLLAIGNIKHHEYVFVPDFFSSTVSIFRHDRNKAAFVLTTGAENVNGVAYKPAGVP